LTDLPQVTVEAHVAVDHQAYPSNPSDAQRWSGRMRRVLERSAAGDIIVADNTAEPLSEAAVDATTAKILFHPARVTRSSRGGGPRYCGSVALTESHRREDALLRLRGASERQTGAIGGPGGGRDRHWRSYRPTGRGRGGLCRRPTPTVADS
jgi:putative ABC transport system permease protein